MPDLSPVSRILAVGPAGLTTADNTQPRQLRTFISGLLTCMNVPVSLPAQLMWLCNPRISTQTVRSCLRCVVSFECRSSLNSLQVNTQSGQKVLLFIGVGYFREIFSSLAWTSLIVNVHQVDKSIVTVSKNNSRQAFFCTLLQMMPKNVIYNYILWLIWSLEKLIQPLRRKSERKQTLQTLFHQYGSVPSHP